jgi:hypothetical protein
MKMKQRPTNRVELTAVELRDIDRLIERELRRLRAEQGLYAAYDMASEWDETNEQEVRELQRLATKLLAASREAIDLYK